MTKLELGQWLPDLPALGNPGLVMARNCRPGAGAYLPMEGPVQVGKGGFDSPAEGLWIATQPNGTIAQFLAANGRIWRIPGAATDAVDVSGPPDYGYASGARWRGATYGNLDIRTNGANPIQAFNLSNLSGTYEELSEDAPKARYITIIRDFVVIGYTTDDIDGEVGNRIRWHGIDAVTGLPDPTEWGISLSTRADFQDIPDLGAVTGLTGGQFGTILCERGVVRLDFGGQLVFSTATVERGIGCLAQGSVADYRQNTVWLGEEGVLYAFDGQSAKPLNKGKNATWLHNDIDLGLLDKMSAIVDVGRGLYMLLYCGHGAADGRPNRLLIYDFAQDAFTISDVTADLLGQVLGFALDLDDDSVFPDLDAADVNLDDPRLWVGGFVRPGFVNNGAIEALAGGPLPATFETGALELVEGRRAVMNRGYVHYEGGDATIRVGAAERPNSTPAFSSAYSPQSDGFYRFRDVGRYFRQRIELSGQWQKAQAVEYWGAGLGQR